MTAHALNVVERHWLWLAFSVPLAAYTAWIAYLVVPEVVRVVVPEVTRSVLGR